MGFIEPREQKINTANTLQGRSMMGWISIIYYSTVGIVETIFAGKRHSGRKS
jgi:hypothetical protein